MLIHRLRRKRRSALREPRMLRERRRFCPEPGCGDDIGNIEHHRAVGSNAGQLAVPFVDPFHGKCFLGDLLVFQPVALGLGTGLFDLLLSFHFDAGQVLLGFQSVLLGGLLGFDGGVEFLAELKAGDVEYLDVKAIGGRFFRPAPRASGRLPSGVR